MKHQLVSMAGRSPTRGGGEWKARCGASGKAGDALNEVTAWTSLVTCPACLAFYK